MGSLYDNPLEIEMKKMIALAALAIALSGCAGWKVPCSTIAKAGCQLVGLIPAVGGTAEALCDAFAGGAWVNDFCTKTVNPRVGDFLAPVTEWLTRHGLSDVVEVKAAPLLLKRKPVVIPIPLAPAPPAAPVTAPATKATK